MIKLIVLLFYILFTPVENNNNEGFEGQIQLKKKSFYDTSFFSYYVKDNMMRVEEYKGNNQLLYSIIIDLEKERVVVLNPEMKAYKVSRPNTFKKYDNNSFEIKKTPYRKKINGYVCYQWRVRNKKMNTEITYWVTNQYFDSYHDFLRVLNKTENSFHYFLQIPENEGYMPIQTVERTLVRHERARYVVTSVNQKDLNNSLFDIPEDYVVVHY